MIDHNKMYIYRLDGHCLLASVDWDDATGEAVVVIGAGKSEAAATVEEQFYGSTNLTMPEARALGHWLIAMANMAEQEDWHPDQAKDAAQKRCDTTSAG